MELRSSTKRTNQPPGLPKPDCNPRKTTTLLKIKRKSIALSSTVSKARRKEFNKLNAVATEKLPPNLISSFSKGLLRKYTIDGETIRTKEGCIFSLQCPLDDSERPTVNLSNTRLKEENLNPLYRHLASSELCFRHLAEVLNRRNSPQGPSFTYKASVQPKLAQLAYLLSRREVSPEKIGVEDVSHRCGNRSCITPDHLVLESRMENLSRESCFQKRGKARRKWLDECPHPIRCILSPRPKPTPSPSPILPKVRTSKPSNRTRLVFAYVLVPPPKQMPTKLSYARTGLLKRERMDLSSE